jgi:hypothetical protein
MLRRMNARSGPEPRQRIADYRRLRARTTDGSARAAIDSIIAETEGLLRRSDQRAQMEGPSGQSDQQAA